MQSSRQQNLSWLCIHLCKAVKKKITNYLIFQKSPSQVIPAVIIGSISSNIFAFRMADFTSVQGFAIDFAMFFVQFYFLVILLSIVRKIRIEKRVVGAAMPTSDAVCVYP